MLYFALVEFPDTYIFYFPMKACFVITLYTCTMLMGTNSTWRNKKLMTNVWLNPVPGFWNISDGFEIIGQTVCLVICVCVCMFGLKFYGLVNPSGSCRGQSDYLTTLFPGQA